MGCKSEPLALIHFFMSSFFFLSNYFNIKDFVTRFSGAVMRTKLKLGTCRQWITLFSETVRPRKLKADIHMGNGLMYRVYRYYGVLCHFSLSSFPFGHIFSGVVVHRKLKLGKHMKNGSMFCLFNVTVKDYGHVNLTIPFMCRLRPKWWTST